jgi:tRNA threonylcarbamoyladenosine biosynthesis protein TsaB
MMATLLDRGPVDIDTWEPQYGRLAEAQVKWEAAHGRPLPASV